MPHIAFLRGINVGGHTLKMDRLRALFVEAGMDQVTTVIASGNVIFDSPLSPDELEPLLAAHLHRALGYAVDTFVRTPDEVRASATHPPFGVDELTEGTLYICYLPAPPPPECADVISRLSTAEHELRVHGRELYWLARSSIARADVDQRALSRALGGSMTMRNLNTVRRILARLPDS